MNARSVNVLRCLLAIVVLACFALSDALATGSLRRGAFGEPESLEPNQSGVSSEWAILRDLFEGLTSFGPDGHVIPGVAESWAVSPNGRQYRFALRANLRWSDGAVLTSDDFVYGFRHTLTPANALARATRLYAIQNAREVHNGKLSPDKLGVSAPDAHTLVIDLEHPLPSLPILLAGEEGFPLPKHVIERARANWTRAGTLVSNGAFMLAERRARGYIRLTRNPHFHDVGQVALDEVVYLPSDDTGSLVNRFRAGELDVNGWPGFISARETALRHELGAAVHASPLTSVRYLRFNAGRAPFDDVRVRAALSLAIDRDLLTRRIMIAGERVSLRVVPLGLADDLAPTRNDLAEGDAKSRLTKARELLAQSRAWQRLGRPVRLRTPSGNGEELCLGVIAMWRQAGINAVLEQSEIKSMIADLRKGDFDIALTGAQDVPSYEAYLERFRRDATNNTGHYASDAFEAALDRAEAIIDPAQRARALSLAEAVLLREHPAVPLIQEVSRALVAMRVHGWIDNPYDIHLSRWLSVK